MTFHRCYVLGSEVIKEAIAYYMSHNCKKRNEDTGEFEEYKPTAENVKLTHYVDSYGIEAFSAEVDA